MKNLLLAFGFILSVTVAHAQIDKVPSVMLKDINGKPMNSANIDNDGKPMIINFWATWCSPCKRELTAIADIYEDWVDETGVKLIAVSIDDSRTARQVKPYVDATGWEYEVYLDINGDLRRAMNVTAPPYTYLVDGEGNIVYQHVGYNPGDEEELYEKLLELTQ